MLTSIVCKMIFYLLYFIIFNLTFSFDYTYDEKVITNLKNKSKKLVDDGNYQLALDIYNIILNIEKNIYSDNDMNLALTYDNISEIHLLLKNYDSALEYIKKSINIYEKNMLHPKEKLIFSLSNMSKVYDSQYNYDLFDKSQKLIKTLEKINNPYSINEIFIDIQYFNEEIEDTAFTYINLAKSYYNRDLFSQSAEYFSKALSLENSNLDFEYYNNLIFEENMFDNNNLIKAFQFLSQSDTTLIGNYFFLSLINKKNGKEDNYLHYMNQYIHYSANN